MKLSTRGLVWRMFVLLTLTAMLLAACGSSSGEQAAPTSAVPVASSEASGTGAAASTPAAASTSSSTDSSAAAGVASPKLNKEVSGTVEFWHHYSSPVRRTAINRVIAICQQQLPNIKVTDTFKPFGEGWTAMIAAVAAGSGIPDVIVEDRPKLPDRALNNVDQPLQQLAQRDGIDGSQFWPFSWEQTIYEGKTYGIPWETEVRVLYYSKTAFEEVGLDPNKPPTTWDELEQYATKLDKKNADGSYERIGFFPLWNIGTDVWGYTNDVEWVSKDGNIVVNTPQTAETLAWIKQWIDRYGGWQTIQNFRANFQAAPNDAFMSGRVAMLADINGYASQLNFFRPKVKNAQGDNVDLDWGVTDLPYKTDKASWSGGFALSIPRGAKNVNAAWEFIKCATGEEAQTSWARDTYSMPANRAAANDPILLADPNWQLFVDAMNYTTGGVFVPQYPNWMEQINQREERVWRGQLDPKIAVEEAQKVIDTQINQ